MKTLNDLFLERTTLHDAEHQLVKALPTMAETATCPHLQQAILSHLEQTKGHVKKVEQVFECFGETARANTCEATQGLIDEAEEIAADFDGSPAINAALIAAAQKVEHYEMASYGCLHEWADILGQSEAAALLKEILVDEKSANEALTDLARERSNQVGAWRG